MSAPEGKFTQETPEMALLEKKMASKCFRVVPSNCSGNPITHAESRNRDRSNHIELVFLTE